MDDRYVLFTLRKIVGLIILVCFATGLCSYSLADFNISFRDIPWLSSEKQVLQALTEQGILTSDMHFESKRRDFIDSWVPYAGCEYPNGVEIKYSSTLGYDRVPQTNYVFRGSYNNLDHSSNPICQVAGYDVSTVHVRFLPKVKEPTNGVSSYDTSDLMFVRAGYDIDDLHYGKSNEVYLDIQSKLTSLYGEPIESNNKMLGTYWHSPDGSGVQLWEFNDSVHIVYAYYNDEAIVDELNTIQHAIDDSEETKKKNSTDGL